MSRLLPSWFRRRTSTAHPATGWIRLTFRLPRKTKVEVHSAGRILVAELPAGSGIWVLAVPLPVDAVRGGEGLVQYRAIGAWEARFRLLLPGLARWLRNMRPVPRWLLWGVARWRRDGATGLASWVLSRATESRDPYLRWVDRYDVLEESDLGAIRKSIDAMTLHPVISLLMPVRTGDARWLEATVESVRAQLYANWELCIAGDGPSTSQLRPMLERYAALDPRIKVRWLESDSSVAAASNVALAMATGDLVGRLGQGDELARQALYQVADAWNRDPSWDLLYTDEDTMDLRGRRSAPLFKPEWNETLFRSYDYVSRFCAMRTSLVRAVGGFREAFNGAQDYDLVLRIVEEVDASRIRHLPFPLYHRRIDQSAKGRAHRGVPNCGEMARRALREHLARCGSEAEVLPGAGDWHRVRYALPDPAPKVSVILCTRDRVELLAEVVRGLRHETDYPDLEILIVDNQSRELTTREFLAELATDPRVRVLSYDAPFNFSAMNNLAARAATGEVLALLNTDLKMIHPDWLREMTSLACRPGVGAVGAKLLYPNNQIQHAGVLLGIAGMAGHAHKGFPRHAPGYASRAQVLQEWSAVTGACLVMKAAVFHQVGGLDEERFAVAYNDVDLCLRLGKNGHRVIYTPHAELYHLESASRGTDESAWNLPRFHRELQQLRASWQTMLDADPAYNPNLTLGREDLGLAFPPRVHKPWRVSRRVPLPSGESVNARAR